MKFHQELIIIILLRHSNVQSMQLQQYTHVTDILIILYKPTLVQKFLHDKYSNTAFDFTDLPGWRLKQYFVATY